MSLSLKLKWNIVKIIHYLIFSELIEGKGHGIFDLLDEESKLPTPKYNHFTSEVHARNKNHFRLSVSKNFMKFIIVLLNVHNECPGWLHKYFHYHIKKKTKLHLFAYLSTFANLYSHLVIFLTYFLILVPFLTYLIIWVRFLSYFHILVPFLTFLLIWVPFLTFLLISVLFLTYLLI